MRCSSDEWRREMVSLVTDKNKLSVDECFTTSSCVTVDAAPLKQKQKSKQTSTNNIEVPAHQFKRSFNQHKNQRTQVDDMRTNRQFIFNKNEISIKLKRKSPLCRTDSHSRRNNRITHTDVWFAIRTTTTFLEFASVQHKQKRQTQSRTSTHIVCLQ